MLARGWRSGQHYTVAYRSALKAKLRNALRQRRERYVAMHRFETTVTEPQDWRPVLDQELNKLLRAAKDGESRKKALDRMERVIQEMRQKVRPADTIPPPSR